MKLKTIIIGLGLIVLVAITLCCCVQQDEFSDIPSIEFIGQTKTTLSQGALMEDSLFVRFSFQDGDGDLGDSDSINVFVTDTRQNFPLEFRIPDLSSGTAGTSLEGEVTMLLFTTCCLYDDNSQAPCTPSTSQPTDEVQFTLQIRDRAGNFSNVIELSPITLMCN